MKTLYRCAVVVILFAACSKQDVVRPNLDGDAVLETRGGFTVTTDPAIDITSFTTTSGGTVSTNGGGNSTSERGICYSTDPNPTIDDAVILSGSGAGHFTCVMPGLASSTMYYVRAYAIKNGAVKYGNQVSCTTYPDDGPVTDIDGNVYQTINIGGQIWMMENLKTTRYRNGDLIPEVTDDASWLLLTSGAFCNYDNDESNGSTYGRIYNWFAATDNRQIAPEGWHVPNLDEWTQLSDYLGGWMVAGGKLKEVGLAHWIAPNYASNSADFSALPGGARWAIVGNVYGGSMDNTAPFVSLHNEGGWWCSAPFWNLYGSYVEVLYFNEQLMGSIGASSGPGNVIFNKKTGYGIRCVKD